MSQDLNLPNPLAKKVNKILSFDFDQVSKLFLVFFIY